MSRKRTQVSGRRTFLKSTLTSALVAGGLPAFTGNAIAGGNPSEWPTFGGNTTNTGVVAPKREPGGKLQTAWQFSTGDAVTSSPAVVDGTVYVGSEDSNVYSLNGKDGSVNWTFETSRGVTHSSPAVVDGTVYVACPGSIYALDAIDGTELWRDDASDVMGPYSVHSSPTVVDGTVYISVGDGTLRAIDAETGARAWTYMDYTYISTPPAVTDGVVHFGEGGNGVVYALDADSGDVRWQFTASESVDLSGQVDSAPAVADGRVFFGCDDSDVYALDTADGGLDWQFSTAGEVNSSPAVGDGTVYVGSNDGTLYALDAADGSPEWTVDTNGEVVSSPAVTSDAVYVGSGDGRVYAVDRGTGNVLGTYATGGRIESSPAVAYGGLCVGSNDGTVYALM